MKNTAFSATMPLTDQEKQIQLLPGVSRTFALTIPQLPEPLRTVVTNAYLLCRIADTIEDDVLLSPEQKAHFHEKFRAVIAAQASSVAFAQELAPQLSPSTPKAEQELIEHIPSVIRCLRSFTPQQTASLQRCVTLMSTGMPEFQRSASLDGVENLKKMDEYCYYVAGVVGEMLTELFCDYSPDIQKHKDTLMQLAPSFGQALQMTNILKDFWDDRSRGVNWLPRDIFNLYDVDFRGWQPNPIDAFAFQKAMRHMVLIAKDHLQNALRYTLLIPPNEVGIRRFTLWAIGLAVLTLRNLYRYPQFQNGQQVKVSRKMVKATILVTNLTARSNRLLQYLFDRMTREIV